MKKKLFITRQLSAEHPTRRILTAQGYEVTGWSLLSFRPVEITDFPPCDWVFAYSATGIRSLPEVVLSGFRQNKSLKFAAMGPGTANAFAENGIAVDFVGQGSPSEIASAFAKTMSTSNRKTKVAFIQAKTSRRSIAIALGSSIIAFEIISYTNEINPKAEVPEADIYYCTSPLNAEALLERIDKDATCTFWAIGETTQRFLHAKGRKAEIPRLEE